MNSLYQKAALLNSFLPLLIVISSAGRLAAVPQAEPEDSPLYARSVREAFARMTARTGLTETRNGAGHAAGIQGTQTAVFMVEGTEWIDMSDTPAVASSSAAKPNRPVPMDITINNITCFITCGSSCSITSCGATCDTTPTCRGYISCHVPQPTCADFTCGTQPTCTGMATCQGYPTCDYSATCMYSSTCNSQQPTCGTTPTCTSTCAPAICPTTLSGVTVPSPGQVRLSFNSSSQLKYVLQCSTNLSSAAWAEACTTNGNGGVLTLSHSNGAPAALYRLLIQNP